MTLEPEILPQAAVVPLRKDEEGNIEVLLVRRDGKVKWGLPKGIIESDQTPEDTARAAFAHPGRIRKEGDRRF